MSGFSLESKVIDNTAVLYPSGYLNDLAGENLEQTCSEYLGKGISRIVLNFGAIELINSVGISILISIMDMMKGLEGKVCFTDLGTLHKETFEMLGLSKHMLIFATEQEALAHFGIAGE